MSSWQQRLYEDCCGCCISEAELRSREIDRQIAEDRVRYHNQLNVVLWGTPGSGKSTFLTQANILFGKDLDNDELSEFRPIIYGEILKGMKVLADARRKLRLEWQDPSNQQHEDKILNFQAPQHIDTEKFMSYFDSIQSLWLDKAIQDAYDRRGEFQLRKSSEYFLKHLDRVGQPEYLPTKADAHYAKAAKGHGGLTKYEFNFYDTTFNIINMGDESYYYRGFKGHQLPWYEDITSILVLVSPVAYDEVLTDGTETNCLVHLCHLFERIINHRFFFYMSVILFFTKTDILEEKIKHSSIKDYFPEFKRDPRKLEDVQSFIFQMFDDRRRERSKALFHFFTTAGNTENIRFVFAAVKDIILENNLKSLKTY